MQLLHRNRSLAVHRARHPIGGVVRGFNSINKSSTTTLHRLTTNDKYFLIPSLVASVGQLAILKKQPLSPVARPGVMAYITGRWFFFSLSLNLSAVFYGHAGFWYFDKGGNSPFTYKHSQSTVQLSWLSWHCMLLSVVCTCLPVGLLQTVVAAAVVDKINSVEQRSCPRSLYIIFPGTPV